MNQDDRDYYRHRAMTSLRMAEEARDDYVAAIHLELARQYQALADNKVLRPKLRIAFTQAEARPLSDPPSVSPVK